MSYGLCTKSCRKAWWAEGVAFQLALEGHGERLLEVWDNMQWGDGGKQPGFSPCSFCREGLKATQSCVEPHQSGRGQWCHWF